MDTNDIEASVITTCKGRLQHLKQSLPTMLAQSCQFNYEVIVVDYGCPQGTFDWLRTLDARSVVAVRVIDGVEWFNLARARNCGASLAQGKVFAFVDADIRLTCGWLADVTAPIAQGQVGLCEAGDTQGWDCCGTCAVAARLYHRVRGYDEAFCGWGNDDCDFYERCQAYAGRARFNLGLLSPIRHQDDQRVAHYAEKSILDSSRSNTEYLGQRCGINPQGYGLGQFEVHRGVQSLDWAAAWVSETRMRPARHQRSGKMPW